LKIRSIFDDESLHILEAGVALDFVTEVNARIKSFYRKRDLSNFAELFYSEEEWCSTKVQPRISAEENIMFLDLSMALEQKNINKIICEVNLLLGAPKIKMFLPRLICTLPQIYIPEWVKNKNIAQNARYGNLNLYIKKQFRGVFYFSHNPLHQDIIDMPLAKDNFISCLIPLGDRSGPNAPLIFSETHSGKNILKPPFYPDFQISDIKSPIELKNNGGFEVEREGLYKFFRPKINSCSCLLWDAFKLHKVFENTSTEPVFNLRYSFSDIDVSYFINDPKNIIEF
jgi:hypothetical protein